MKKILSLLTLQLLTLVAFAQTGNLTGSLKDANETPILGANVSINNTSYGIQTDNNGYFSINNIEQGNYILKISYIGFKTKELPFTITEGETLKLGSLVIYEGNEILNEIVLKGERRNKFSRKGTAYVSKLPLKDLENTQVYSTVTNEILKSQVVTNFDDALKNATGVEQLWISTGRGGDGAGYYSLRGFSVQPQLVNGLPGLTNGTINPANIERIEVLKGPSATLFGNTVSSYGGLINVVTKKPYVGTGF